MPVESEKSDCVPTSAETYSEGRRRCSPAEGHVHEASAAAQRAAKTHQNLLTEQFMARMQADGLHDLLMMGAGPWKHASCLSAYCVDAQKMADAVHMKCWANDGKVRYFSLILF